jgi:hypothetical protein
MAFELHKLLRKRLAFLDHVLQSIAGGGPKEKVIKLLLREKHSIESPRGEKVVKWCRKSRAKVCTPNDQVMPFIQA